MRLTKKRQEILDTLKSHHHALTVSELHQKLPHIDLVTIYRTVDLLAKNQLIKKICFNSDQAHYEYQEERHHHALCSKCQKVIHFHVPNQKIAKLLNLEGFNIEDIEIIVRGTCSR